MGVFVRNVMHGFGVGIPEARGLSSISVIAAISYTRRKLIEPTRRAGPGAREYARPRRKEMDEQIAQLKAERDFLLQRAGAAGSCNFTNERWTGVSSNGLVTIAFGGQSDDLPLDGSDLAACYRTVMRLPAHLKTDAVMEQLRRGEEYIASRRPDDVEWAREISGWAA